MEQEAANMALMADNFHRRAAAWSGSYLALNEAVKQLGDVAQWTQVVDADMKFIAMYVYVCVYVIYVLSVTYTVHVYRTLIVQASVIAHMCEYLSSPLA